MDIIVTTPKKAIKLAEQEARDCIEAGGGWYFRRVPSIPRQTAPGSRVFYVEDGFIRGFAILEHIQEVVEDGWTCETTGITYPPGFFLVMRADSWKWIRPLTWAGFQGFRYFPGWMNSDVKVIGDWLMPKPDLHEVLGRE